MQAWRVKLLLPMHNLPSLLFVPLHVLIGCEAFTMSTGNFGLT